jgi:type II secretory pathway pseudopilin PulG
MAVTWKSNEGMTLLEVTFAAGVLATALAMLFGALLNMRVIGQVSSDRSVALANLASVMEDLRGSSYDDLINYTQPTVHGPGVSNAVLLECFDADGNGIPLPWEAGDADAAPPGAGSMPNPITVKATFAWTDERGRIFSVHTATQIGR